MYLFHFKFQKCINSATENRSYISKAKYVNYYKLNKAIQEEIIKNFMIVNIPDFNIDK